MKQMRVPAGALLIVAALAFAAGCTKQSSKVAKQPVEVPKPVPVVEPAPGAVGLPASGGAAITPLANSQITDAQVRSYVLSHRVPRALRATNVAVLSSSFISSKQVRALLHSASLGVPDEEPMCLVVMSGEFVFSGPPGSHTATFPIAVELFNARTGNLLQVGGLPRPPPAATP